MVFIAGGLIARAVGIGMGRRDGRATMPWPARILSWCAFAVPGVMLGLTASTAAIAVLGAFVVLDAAGGLAARDQEDRESTRRRRSGIWKRTKAPLLVTLYLVLVALVHFSLSIYLPFGTLLTWSLLAFGFALWLRASIVGPKAKEDALRAPLEHRRHERREEPVPDPQRVQVERALTRIRQHRDPAPLLEAVRNAARDADLDDAQIQQLEARVRAHLADARRDDAISRALDELERAIAPARPAPTPPAREVPS